MSTQNFEQLMNLYGNIKIICIIGASLFLIAAVILFFVLKIPSVFGELTGRTAKKAIEEMISSDHSGSLGASRKIGDDGLRRKSKITGILGKASAQAFGQHGKSCDGEDDRTHSRADRWRHGCDAELSGRANPRTAAGDNGFKSESRTGRFYP